MAGRECYHCKQWIEPGEAHDCWTTTEGALTKDLAEDLQDAYERIREAALELGEQRVYASHSSIMFSRKTCYFFVRPRKKFLEVCIFLGRRLTSPKVRTTTPTSKVKVANMLRIQHRDEVEPPITDWMREAYELQETGVSPAGTGARAARKRVSRPKAPARPRAAKNRRLAKKR